MAPAGTPQPIVDRLNAEINKALQKPKTKKMLLSEAASGSAKHSMSNARAAGPNQAARGRFRPGQLQCLTALNCIALVPSEEGAGRYAG
jgi:hypothetical protein